MPPSHLVLFHEDTQDSTRVARRLGMQPVADHPRSRKGLAVLECTTQSRHSATHYHSLGVLAGHLSDDHVKACEDASDVTHVFRNEVHRVPVHIDSAPAAPHADLQPCTDALALLGMPATYDRYSGDGVCVALLDTGIDLHHPEFAGRFTEGVNAVSFVEGESVQDGLGHGTHCAGIIAGPASPREGARFAVAPDVRLLVGKVLSDGGLGSDHQVVDGIHWALHEGARVISLSLGSSRAPGGAANTLYEHLAQRTLASDQGALLIAATGNESQRPASVAAVENPAAAPSVMAVAAVDGEDRVAFFSGGQRDAIGEVNVAAPGVGVRSTWIGGAYKSISGTSMATPHVAAVAALHLQQSPTLSPQALWQRLEQHSRRCGEVADVGHGVVQAP